MIRTMHDATTERHAHDAAMEARAMLREAPAIELGKHNASEREAAMADRRIGLLNRKGRVVAYAHVGGAYVEGNVAQVIAALNA